MFASRTTLAGLAVLATAGCGSASSAPPRTTPTPKPAAAKPNVITYAVTDPVDILPDAAGAWVLSRDGDLVRIDAASGKVGAPLPAGTEKLWRDQEALTRVGDTLFMADAQKGLLRFDARTGKPHGKPIALGHPNALAGDGRTLWVAAAGTSTLTRVDLKTLKASKPMRLKGSLRAVGATGGRLWTVDDKAGVVSERDPGTGDVIAKLSMDASASGMSAGSDLWINDTDGATVVASKTLAKLGRWTPGVDSYPITAGDGDGGAWGVSETDPTLVHLDGAAKTIQRIALPRPGTTLAVGPDAVWVAADGGPIYRVPR